MTRYKLTDEGRAYVATIPHHMKAILLGEKEIDMSDIQEAYEQEIADTHTELKDVKVQLAHADNMIAKLRTELEKAWEEVDVSNTASAEDAQQVFLLRQALEAVEPFIEHIIAGAGSPDTRAYARRTRKILQLALKGGE